jgi:DNA-binding transcriptional regulator PaaX
MYSWLHLIYKIPPKPTSLRVGIWRKLKRLGAVLLQDSVWILPHTPQTLEHFQWIATEIKEKQGEAMVWESRLVFGEEEEEEVLIQKFIEQVNVDYEEILTQLKKKKVDLVSLARRYQQIKMRDYFHSELGKEVYMALKKSRGGKE